MYKHFFVCIFALVVFSVGAAEGGAGGKGADGGNGGDMSQPGKPGADGGRGSDGAVQIIHQAWQDAREERILLRTAFFISREQKNNAIQVRRIQRKVQICCNALSS